MRKNKKIIVVLIIMLFIMLIAILTIGMILIKKNKINEFKAENTINNGDTNITEETDKNIIIIGINKHEGNKGETNNETIEDKNESITENKISISNTQETKIKNTNVGGEKSSTAIKVEINEIANNTESITNDIYALNSNIGTLYIPKTKLTTSVYCNSSPTQMEKMPCFLYTTGGLNKNGITLIVGHNRRNGKIFSNNKRIEQGDEFYFTDLEGRKLKYKVYSKFITKDNDTSFLNGDFVVPTIALSCCTDASDDNRIIILGKAE